MLNGSTLILLGLLSAFAWAREIYKAYRHYSFLRPSTLATLRQQGSNLFGVCVGLCALGLGTGVLMILCGVLGKPLIQ
jgi:hypothetical protein